MFIGDREIGAGRLTEKRAITDASPRRECAETAIELATTINAELAEPARCTLPAFSGITLISSNNGHEDTKTRLLFFVPSCLRGQICR